MQASEVSPDGTLKHNPGFQIQRQDSYLKSARLCANTHIGNNYSSGSERPAPLDIIGFGRAGKQILEDRAHFHVSVQELQEGKEPLQQ